MTSTWNLQAKVSLSSECLIFGYVKMMELLSGPCHYGQTLTDRGRADLFSLAQVIVFVISRNSNYVSMMGLSVKLKAKAVWLSFSHKKQTSMFFYKIPFMYRKSSKETRGSYSFSEAPTAGLIRNLVKFCSFYLLFFKFTAGLIRMRVLFEGGSLSRIYGSTNIAFGPPGIFRITLIFTLLLKVAPPEFEALSRRWSSDISHKISLKIFRQK